MRSNLVTLFTAISLAILAAGAHATPPPYEAAPLPRAYLDRLAANPQAFRFQRAFKAMTERAAVVRQLSAQPQLLGIAADGSALSASLSSALGGSAVSPPPNQVQGTRKIPVVLLDFPESGAKPFTPDQLKQELFDGPWPTGTLTQYYAEVSNGALDVKGTVLPWKTLSKSADYYAGADFVDADGVTQHCYGLCLGNSRIADLIKEALDANKTFDWRDYDNDGPDGQPNSADDDGFVDFVAFVHAGRGGECRGEGNTNIWSHRGSLSENLGLQPYTTTSRRAAGGFIKIDDYVVLPALACDGSTMIPIGVIAHEFGHAFDLPDLYDVTGHSAGLGNWDLMATGSWGGDGHSPETPAHMSAWSKQFLGWIEVKDVVGMAAIPLQPIEKAHTAYRVRVSNNLYYLVSATDKSGFDSKLPTGGMVVLLVNESVVKSGLRSNTVNSDVTNMGVKVVEADGLDRLTAEPFRGDAADIFPGTTARRGFDSTTLPASLGGVSICGIPDPGNPMTVQISTTGGNCTPVRIASSAAPVRAASSPPPSPPPPAASPGAGETKSAAALKEGTNVVIQGVLRNEGTNYFDRKSRQIVLRDEKGEEVHVTTALPLTATPAVRPPGGTLSEFLDKKVEIRGVVEKAANGNTPPKVRALDMRVVQ